MKETLLNEVNRRFPPGTLPLKYIKDGEEKSGVVRWPAESILDTGREVIWIKGELSAIDLKNVIL